MTNNRGHVSLLALMSTAVAVLTAVGGVFTYGYAQVAAINAHAATTDRKLSVLCVSEQDAVYRTDQNIQAIAEAVKAHVVVGNSNQNICQ